MYLKQCKYKNGKTFLSIAHGYRYNGVKKEKIIQKIGYLSDLEKEYDNPIEHFKNVAKQMTNDNKNLDLIIKNINNRKIKIGNSDLNIGYVFIKKIYEELDFKNFFKHKQSKLKIEYDLNSIFSLLVFSRILFPGSKKETFDGKNRFFETFDVELKDIYRSLDHFNNYKDEIETLIWNNTKNNYNRDTSNTYYDCTNYYFEINYNDEDLVDEEGNVIVKNYRKRGPEKNHRPDPIIELGLLMDANDIPLAYDLFSGNESEKLSLRPIVKQTKAKFNLGRTIVVADRGLNTSDNIFFLAGKNDKINSDGYIYGQSVRGADKEFKEWVLSQEGYIDEPCFNEDGSPETFRQMKFNDEGKLIGYEKKQVYFRHKSRIYPKEITIKREGKRNTKVRTDQKQMVYYSQKYADKQKRDRNQMIERAKDIIANPKKYDKITAKGAKSYINNIKFVKDTGEVADGLDLSLKLDKIAEEEKYDGYYSIVTSELQMNDKELRKRYRGLSKIEETFKITKTDLETRPVYVWTKEHIESHFLTCFVALVILRLLEQKTNKEIPIGQLIENIKQYNCSYLEENYYQFKNYTETIEKLSKIFNIDLSLEYQTKQNIKKILNYWKKGNIMEHRKNEHFLIFKGFARFWCQTQDIIKFK